MHRTTFKDEDIFTTSGSLKLMFESSNEYEFEEEKDSNEETISSES
jgi:hypothetical protein